MNEPNVTVQNNAVARIPLLAAVVAIVGLFDSIYLTIHHINGVQVPCGVTGGCETVLTSQYAEVFGIPLAAFGVAAYFIAFCLAILAAFGYRSLWFFFGFQVVLMALASSYFVYLQIFVLRSICQYCMVSAAVCFTLCTLAVITKFWKR